LQDGVITGPHIINEIRKEATNRCGGNWSLIAWLADQKVRKFFGNKQSAPAIILRRADENLSPILINLNVGSNRVAQAKRGKVMDFDFFTKELLGSVDAAIRSAGRVIPSLGRVWVNPNRNREPGPVESLVR